MVYELKKEGVQNNKINNFIALLEDRDPNIKQSKYYSKLFEYSDNVRQFVKKI